MGEVIFSLHDGSIPQPPFVLWLGCTIDFSSLNSLNTLLKREWRSMLRGERLKMARGNQKIQSQQKGLEKAAKLKKATGNSKQDKAKTAAAGLKCVCCICKTAMPDQKIYKLHFESKHSKSLMPEELKDIQT